MTHKIIINNIEIPIPYEAAILLIPALCSSSFPRESLKIQSSFDTQQLIESFNSLLDLFHGKKYVQISADNSEIYYFLGFEFDNVQLRDLSEIAKTGVSVQYSLPPLYLLPHHNNLLFPISTFEIEILKASKFKVNPFILFCISPVIRSSFKQKKYDNVHIRIDFLVSEALVKSFGSLFLGEILRIKQNNCSFLKVMAQKMQIKKLTEACSRFLDEQNLLSMLHKAYPNLLTQIFVSLVSEASVRPRNEPISAYLRFRIESLSVLGCVSQETLSFLSNEHFENVCLLIEKYLPVFWDMPREVKPLFFEGELLFCCSSTPIFVSLMMKLHNINSLTQIGSFLSNAMKILAEKNIFRDMPISSKMKLFSVLFDPQDSFQLSIQRKIFLLAKPRKIFHARSYDDFAKKLRSHFPDCKMYCWIDKNKDLLRQMWQESGFCSYCSVLLFQSYIVALNTKNLIPKFISEGNKLVNALQDLLDHFSADSKILSETKDMSVFSRGVELLESDLNDIFNAITNVALLLQEIKKDVCQAQFIPETLKALFSELNLDFTEVRTCLNEKKIQMSQLKNENSPDNIQQAPKVLNSLDVSAPIMKLKDSLQHLFASIEAKNIQIETSTIGIIDPIKFLLQQSSKDIYKLLILDEGFHLFPLVHSLININNISFINNRSQFDDNLLLQFGPGLVAHFSVSKEFLDSDFLVDSLTLTQLSNPEIFTMVPSFNGQEVMFPSNPVPNLHSLLLIGFVYRGQHRYFILQNFLKDQQFLLVDENHFWKCNPSILFSTGKLLSLGQSENISFEKDIEIIDAAETDILSWPAFQNTLE